jgi:hypothetical protein
MNEALSAVVALLLISAPAALAQDRKAPRMSKEQAIERMFQELDVDKSGAVERVESNASWEKRFQAMDLNGDGAISREEGVTARGKRDMPEERRKRTEEWRAKRFASLDADGDGKVTLAEFQAKRAQVFSEADTNGDGKVTKDEMVSRWEKNGERGHKK